MNATCPWCSAPRDTGATCPRCGADYFKAEAIKTKGRATEISNAPHEAAQGEPVALIYASEPEGTQGAQLVSNAALEFKFCVGAIPIALLLAMMFHASGMFAMLQRIAFTMPVHELGHAITGWFCGFTAIPYGTMDGMASDSMKLVEQHGWTLDILVQRYVMLGLCCLVVLAAVYAWGVWRAKAEMETRELADKRAEWANRKRDNT